MSIKALNFISGLNTPRLICTTITDFHVNSKLNIADSNKLIMVESPISMHKEYVHKKCTNPDQMTAKLRAGQTIYTSTTN